MKLLHFIESWDYKTCNNDSVVFFQSRTQSYQFLFFSTFIQNIRKKFSLSFESIDITNDLSVFIPKFEMQFLGTQSLYWLGDTTQLSEKKKKTLYTYLQNYNGPNILLLFGHEKDWCGSGMIVDIPEDITQKECEKLCTYESVPLSNFTKQFLIHLFSQKKSLSLDTVYGVMRYLLLGGHTDGAVLQEWVDTLIEPEQSLFVLSGFLLGKKPQKFYAQWSSMRAYYSDIFWVSFWSEQLWRAHYAHSFLSKDSYIEAKRIAFRLPFSFMKNDWRNVSSRELKNAHTFIYSLDYHFKNGGQAHFFDLFFINFFSGTYKSIK